MREQQLLDRIERLEEKTRRLTVIAIGVSIALVCFACVAASPKNDDVIVARGLKSVDAQGKVRADILVDTFDDAPTKDLPKDIRRAGLRLLGKDGKPLLRLEMMDGSDEKGKSQLFAGLMIRNRSTDAPNLEGKDAMAAIAVENEEARLGVNFGDHSADLSSTSRSGAALYVRDQTSKFRIATVKPMEIGVEDNSASPHQSSTLNAQRLSIFQGAQGLSLGTTELQAKATGDQIKTSPTLVLFDKDGNVTWRAGR